MKIVLCSDAHLDAKTAGFARYEDVANAFNQVVEHCQRVKADRFIFLGDLCDPDAANLIRCMKVAQRVAAELEASDIQSSWLAGNHDVLEDGYGTTTLDLVNGESSTVVKFPGIYPWDSIAFLPYTPMSNNYDPVEVVKKWKDPPKLICSHLMIEGISVGSETTEFPRGRDVFLPIDLIRELYPNAIVVSGHYHEAQTFKGVHVVGSMARLTRGEISNTPQFLTLDIP